MLPGKTFFQHKDISLRNVVSLVVLLCFVVGLAGCRGSSQTSAPSISQDPAKLKVAVSIVPQETFVRAIAGDHVDIITMVPPGSSPENYAPSPQQMAEFSEAQIYFAMGVPTEKANILPKAAEMNKDIKIIDLPVLVDAIYPAREIAPGERDPHMWLSPKRVKEMVRITAEELSALDQDNADLYKQNASTYIAQLDVLDKDIRDSLQGLPNNKIIVYHPAFGYFADDYGLEMISIEKEGKEASAADFQRVIDRARKENIKVIFYQAEIDSKQSRSLAEELKGQTEMIAPLAPDYIENLEKTARTFARVLQ